MKTTARLALTLSTLMLLVGSAAHAANRIGDVPTKTVSFRALDLSTSQGAQALYDRIEAAAREVCRGAELADYDACRARAIEGAVNDVSHPLLSAAHRSGADRFAEVAR
ncbi:MAG TPA: UrcA family protein [Gammaproteobacteria bacterium]|nr:UrcA family protein [Gammaproteobacteria bacterium]